MRLSEPALALLAAFEAELDPAHPEGGGLGARVIGYGEMSTVFIFEKAEHPELRGVAFKRMALFHSQSELEKYQSDYLLYNQVLQDLGLRVPEFGAEAVPGRGGRIVLYLSQKMLQGDWICHKALHRLSESDALRLFEAVLAKLDLVFDYNRADHKRRPSAIGFDAQLSNWAVVNPPSDQATLPESIELAYLDTSTPLMRVDGVEQLNPELFLRICPAALRWVVRLFFLKDVLNRYYDLRLVLLDIIANLYKEKKAELIAPFLERAAGFLKERGLRAITEKETRAYYKEDARIWSIFMSLRRMERGWRGLLGRPYELILPGKVER